MTATNYVFRALAWLKNNDALTAKNAADSANVDLIKLNSSDLVSLANGQFTIDPTTGAMVAAGFLGRTVGNTLTASGTTRADALALTKSINRITTAGSGTGVILPSAASVGEGGSVVVFNAGANAVQVYGAGSDTIDTVTSTTGVPLTNAKRAIYYVIGGVYVSAQLGVVSA